MKWDHRQTRNLDETMKQHLCVKSVRPCGYADGSRGCWILTHGFGYGRGWSIISRMTKPTKPLDDCFFSMFQAGTSSLQPQVQRVEVSDFGKGAGNNHWWHRHFGSSSFSSSSWFLIHIMISLSQYWVGTGTDSKAKVESLWISSDSIEKGHCCARWCFESSQHWIWSLKFLLCA